MDFTMKTLIIHISLYASSQGRFTLSQILISLPHYTDSELLKSNALYQIEACILPFSH